MVHTCVAHVEVFRQDKQALYVVASHGSVWARQIGSIHWELTWKYLCKTNMNRTLGAVMEMRMLDK